MRCELCQRITVRILTESKKIKNVQVQCAADKGFKNIVKSAMVGKKKKKAVIKGLKKKTTYYVRVRYFDGTGYSAWSKVKKVKTK